MGKAKKRIFNRSRFLNHMSLTREAAIFEVVKNFKYDKFDKETEDLITMFGLSAEELSEAGAAYEELKVYQNILS